MFAIVIYLFLLLIFGVLNTNTFRSKFNYANIFLLLWCVIPSLSAFGFYDFYKPPFEAHVYIILAIITFEITTLITKRIHIIKENEIETHPSTERINWTILLIISLICLAVIFPFFIISIRFALSNGFYYLRIKVLNNELFSARNRIILQDVIQPLVITTTLASIYHLVENRKIKIVTIISVLNCGLYMMTIGNRWLIMEVLLMIVVIVVGKYAFNIVEILRKNKWATRIVALLIVGMVFITVQRSIRGSTGLLYDVYSYFVGSIHFFGLAVSSPSEFALDSSHYLWGQELISAFVGLINNIGAAFGNSEIISSGLNTINEITQKYYFVSPTTHMNNNITMIYGFMRDCGVVGVIFDTTVLALFCMFVYKRRNKSIYTRFRYIFNLTLLPFLIFEWFYGRTFVLIVFLILTLLDITSKKKLRIKI